MTRHMKLFTLACAIAVSFASLAKPRPQDSAEVAQLSRLETVWNNAHLHGDAAALDKLWADDLIVTVPKMSVMTKADALGFLRSGHMQILRYETSSLRIKVYGDAAVVTGRLQRRRGMNGHEMNDDWRFIKVYVRREGRWQVVAWQASETAPQPGS